MIPRTINIDNTASQVHLVDGDTCVGTFFMTEEFMSRPDFDRVKEAVVEGLSHVLTRIKIRERMA